VLADDATDGDDADVHETNRDKYEKEAEKFTEQRDSLAVKIMKSNRAQVQFLKSFYKPDVHLLGDWDVTVNDNRIVLPSVFLEWVEYFTNFKAKHDSFVAPAVSPLLAYLTQNNIDLAADALKIAD